MVGGAREMYRVQSREAVCSRMVNETHWPGFLGFAIIANRRGNRSRFVCFEEPVLT